MSKCICVEMATMWSPTPLDSTRLEQLGAAFSSWQLGTCQLSHRAFFVAFINLHYFRQTAYYARPVELQIPVAVRYVNEPEKRFTLLHCAASNRKLQLPTVVAVDSSENS